MNTEKIHKILKSIVDKDYTCEFKINKNGKVDADGDVYITKDVSELPIKFGKVSGNFDCGCINLKTLRGCPEYVDGYFDCSYNNLKSLRYCPRYVGKNFYCDFNEIKSLKYTQKHLYGNLSCSYNNLIDFNNCPESIDGDFDCSNNYLRTFENGPKVIKGDYIFSQNNISQLCGFPEYFYNSIIPLKNPIHEILKIVPEDKLNKFIKYLIEFDVLRKRNKIVEIRLEEAYFITIKKELSQSKRRFKNYKLI